MKNNSSESKMKLNQFADVLVVEKKIKNASQKNSNGKKWKKPYKFELIGKL